MALFTPNIVTQFFDVNGDPLSGGSVYTYTEGTTNLLATYTTPEGDIQNANPVILDAAGKADIYLRANTNYKFVVYDKDGVLLERVEPVFANTLSAPFIDASSFGLVGDGVTDDTAALQAAINAATGVLYIPPGSYKVTTLTVLQKNPGSSGSFRIEATGVIFVGDGTGDFIIDSCKRVSIIGLDMPTHDLVWRGQWWGYYNSVRFQRLVINDAAGTSFSSNYWTKFDTCVFQSVVTSSASTSNTNAITWDNCSMRGNVGQGFIATRNYAVEFNGNQNAQDWEFINCDLSYFNTDIFFINPSNVAEVELRFVGCYFDTFFPKSLDRAKTSIITDRCHSANDVPHWNVLAGTTRGGQNTYRQDRSAGYTDFNSVNFIPNGDFRVRLPVYSGANLPVGASGGATITDETGGLFGTMLRINQATSGTVRFRSVPLPFDGSYTGKLIIKIHTGANQTLRFIFNGLYEEAIVTGEWHVFSLVAPSISAGATVDLAVYSETGAAFDIDVAYASITYGTGGEVFVPSPSRNEIQHSASWNPTSIATMSNLTVSHTIDGAALGDIVLASHNKSLLGCMLTGYVSAADTVTLVLFNPTAGSIDIDSGTVIVRVLKNSFII